MQAAPRDLPMHVGGRRAEAAADELAVRAPHRHDQVLGRLRQATADDVQAAVDAALEASRSWAHTTLEERAAVFLRAADLLAGPWRARPATRPPCWARASPSTRRRSTPPAS